LEKRPPRITSGGRFSFPKRFSDNPPQLQKCDLNRAAIALYGAGSLSIEKFDSLR
jgi:hypothetical protein